MIKKILFVSGLMWMVSIGHSQTLKLMTYNIRYDNPYDGDNRWDLRKNELADQIKFYEPGILGIQEGLNHQVKYLDSSLADYSWFGVGRDGGKTKGEYCAIFYKKSDFEIIKGNTFWLSETPRKISVGWDASMERICTWVLFRGKSSDQQFYVFNTHFDHIGKVARQNSASLILKKIEEINTGSLPVFLMGDFNMEPLEEGIQIIKSKLDDSKNAASLVGFGPDATFNDFKFIETPTILIDYIFTSKNIGVKKYAVLTDSKEKRYYSDHFPVFVEIE